MNRRAKTLIAVLSAVVLCLGTWEVASAVALKAAAVSATQPATGCATSTGLLRLTNASGKCPSGTTKAFLSRASTAPKGVVVTTSTVGAVDSKSMSLLASTTLHAQCSSENGGASAGDFTVTNGGPTQVDGTSFLVLNGGGIVDYVRDDGGVNRTPTGASSVISNDSGGFVGETEASSDFATLNAHLLIKVPGALFTVDLVIDVNGGNCRVSAMIQSAATS